MAILGLCFAAILKPDYLSEGKILAEAQTVAPDIVKPVITATASERVQLIQQRIVTSDNLVSVASKFGLFPGRTGVPDLMRESLQIKPVDVEGQQPRYGAPSPTIAFTVGFQYDDPEIAMRVANEFVALILGEDARSRTSRATEAVRILAGETKDIEDKLESNSSPDFSGRAPTTGSRARSSRTTEGRAGRSHRHEGGACSKIFGLLKLASHRGRAEKANSLNGKEPDPACADHSN